MLRGIMENVFSPQASDDIFADTAQRQRSGELLFSSVVDLLALVVCRERRSVNNDYVHA